VLSRFARYLGRRFAFNALVATLTDTRHDPQIPTAAVWLSVFWGFTLRRSSLNALEGELRLPGRWEALVGSRKPSADTCAYTFARFDLDRFRQDILWPVGQRLKRMKVLRPPVAGLFVAAVDGHELWASRKRCCAQCLIRTLQTKTGPVTEYYHRVVVCQLVGVTPPLVLDLEFVRPGEDEVAAARRLLARLLAAWPTCADVFTCDALYFDASFVTALRAQGKHVVIVLKEERLLLFQDAEGLVQLTTPTTFEAGRTTVTAWDLADVTSWEALGGPIRVVRADERTLKRKRIARKWVDRVDAHRWQWATTCPATLVPLRGLWQIGHWRWDLEERGFMEWARDWGFDHCFKHDPTAILAFLFTLVLAHALTVVFWTRALKPALTAGKTRLWLALRFQDDLVTLAGVGVWARPP